LVPGEGLPNIRAMPDLSSAATAIQLAQWVLVAAGLGLTAVWFCAPKLRALRRQPAPLPPWDAPLLDTLLACWVPVCAALVGSLLIGEIARRFELQKSQGWLSVLSVIGFQGAMTAALFGFALYRRLLNRPLPPLSRNPPAPLTDRLLLGAAVFAASLPFVYVTSTAAAAVMEFFGLPIAQQDLANLFASTNSAPLVLVLTFMAVVVVPLGEELLFRAGLFRIFRQFLPRRVALLLSALAFAALHFNTVHFVPLVVLGLVFALAYEKTGSLLVPVVAHGLFNLNSIVRLLAGLGGNS
jgi:membrane protease YdiL (CAAX protease family)